MSQKNPRLDLDHSGTAKKKKKKGSKKKSKSPGSLNPGFLDPVLCRYIHTDSGITGSRIRETIMSEIWRMYPISFHSIGLIPGDWTM